MSQATVCKLEMVITLLHMLEKTNCRFNDRGTNWRNTRVSSCQEKDAGVLFNSSTWSCVGSDQIILDGPKPLLLLLSILV